MDVVLLDTIVLVSALINSKSKPAKLLIHWKENKFNLVVSDILLKEFSEVIRHPRIRGKYKITDKEVKELEKIILDKAIFVPTFDKINFCRDSDDNVILETAIVGKANYVVTGDRDIRTPELVKYLAQNKIEITTVNKYLNKLEGK